MVKVIIDS